MIDNIKPFLCTREESREKIKKGINRVTKKEASKPLTHSELVSISRCVRHTFCGKYHDLQENVYLIDELDPEKITDYWIEFKKSETNRDDIYNYVCWQLLVKVNEFTKQLKEGYRNYNTNLHYKRLVKCFGKKFAKLLDKRLQEPLKMLRSRPQ